MLGQIGGEEDRATLLSIAEGPDALARQMALVALTRLAPATDKVEERATVDALADALFEGGDPESPRDQAGAAGIRRAGAAALMTLGEPSKRYEWGERRAGGGAGRTRSAALDNAIDVDRTPSAASSRPSSPADHRAAAPHALRSADRARPRRSSLSTSPNRRGRTVVEAMADGDGALQPFVGLADPSAAAHDAARRISRELEPRLADLREPAPHVIVQLARSRQSGRDRGGGSAPCPIPNEAIQGPALSALGSHANREVRSTEVSRILFTHESWAMRVLAAEAMGRLGGAGARAVADASLRHAATHDSYALVREAALSALASFDADAARPLARTIVGDGC